MRCVSIGLLALLIVGCESKTGTGALVGAGIGVGAGALIGGGSGALIGGAAGAVGGALVGYLLDQEDRQKMEQTSPQTLKKIDNGKPLSMRDVEKMSQAEISDDKIIGAIDATNSTYHLSTSDVEQLKKAGVSDRVIDYMLQTN